MPDGKLISANALIDDLLNKSFYPVIVKRAIENAPVYVLWVAIITLVILVILLEHFLK